MTITEECNQILKRCRQHIIMHYSYLRRAMANVKLVLSGGGDDGKDTLATDGEYIFVSTRLCQMFKKKIPTLSIAIIHSVYHCIYNHTKHENIDMGEDGRELWSYACDIFVNVKMIMRKIAPFGIDVKSLMELAKSISPRIATLNAEQIFFKLCQSMKLGQAEVDQHYMWGTPYGLVVDYSIDALKSNMNIKAHTDVKQDEWEEVARTMDFEVNDLVNVSSYSDIVKRMSRDYALHDKLRQFLTHVDTGRESQEEFDYIYYVYGLDNFDNMPLIDSCENKDVGTLLNIVVVLDTSKSITKEIFAKYMRIVYAIFSYFDTTHKYNMIILQADDKVRRTQTIGSLEELDYYLKDTRISGRGGTDFVTAIDHVSANIENARGILYLSDGYGRFPDVPPSYPVMMIFDDRADNNYNVPDWFEKHIVTKESR